MAVLTILPYFYLLTVQYKHGGVVQPIQRMHPAPHICHPVYAGYVRGWKRNKDLNRPNPASRPVHWLKLYRGGMQRALMVIWRRETYRLGETPMQVEYWLFVLAESMFGAGFILQFQKDRTDDTDTHTYTGWHYRGAGFSGILPGEVCPLSRFPPCQAVLKFLQ